MTQPPKPQHLRAVPAGGGHRVEPGLGDPPTVIDGAVTEGAPGPGAYDSTRDPSSPEYLPPSEGSGIQRATAAIAGAIAEPVVHAALVVGVVSAGALVGGLTGRTWASAGIGAGVNLFLYGLASAVFGWRTLSPVFRWGYLALALAGGGGAGYALWVSSQGAGGRRRIAA